MADFHLWRVRASAPSAAALEGLAPHFAVPMFSGRFGVNSGWAWEVTQLTVRGMRRGPLGWEYKGVPLEAPADEAAAEAAAEASRQVAASGIVLAREGDAQFSSLGEGPGAETRCKSGVHTAGWVSRQMGKAVLAHQGPSFWVKAPSGSEGWDFTHLGTGADLALWRITLPIDTPVPVSKHWCWDAGLIAPYCKGLGLNPEEIYLGYTAEVDSPDGVCWSPLGDQQELSDGWKAFRQGHRSCLLVPTGTEQDW